MGVSQLVKATVVVPRSELNLTLRELAEFEWFHPSQPETITPDPIIDDLNSRVYRLFLELDELVKEIGIKLQPAIIDTILKGYKVEKNKFTVNDWADFTAQIDAEARPITQELRQLLDELSSVNKSLLDDNVLQATLLMLSKFSIDLKELSRLRRFHILFTVSSTKDLKEIRRSLPEGIIVDVPVTKSESALLIVSSQSESDRIEKVLRSFELKPFTIPERLPQNPAEACKVVQKSVEGLTTKMAELRKALENASQKTQQKLLTLREAALTIYTVLNQMRKSGDLKRFGILQGYIPADKIEDFRGRHGHRLSLIEEVGHSTEVPTLLKNRGESAAFQNITLTQGPPKSGEFDPTPMIALIFPIFYGMMFADFGHGLVLLMMGLLLRIRGDPSMKQWGTIFAGAGIAAIVFGVIVGEVFGLELGGLPGPIGKMFHDLQILHVADMNQETVLLLLKAGILIGVFHITVGLALDVAKGFKEKDRLELYVVKIPSIIMYVFGVFYALAFIGSGFDFLAVIFRSAPGSLNPTPLLSDLTSTPIPVWLVGRISMPIVLAAVFVIIFGKTIAGFLGKHKEEGPAMSIIMGVVEFILRLVEFLANTVSYARLGILLLVHASLMVLAKIALEGGIIGIPIAIIWNLVVIMIEGLIVYIQALRLHIYEWFTKFYEGTGTLFNKVLPDTRYVEIQWEKSRQESEA